MAALALAGAACGGLEEGEGLGSEVLVGEDPPEEVELVTVAADEPIAGWELPTPEGEALADDAEASGPVIGEVNPPAGAIAPLNASPPDVAEVGSCTCESVHGLGEEALLIDGALPSDGPAPDDALEPADGAGAGGGAVGETAPAEELPSDEPPSAEEPSSTEPEADAAEILPS